MIAPARRAAVDVLHAVLARRVDLPDALALARTRLTDERDRALLAEIATGTLRWLAALDHVIGGASTRPVGKLDPAILDILRLSTYQLLHLDRVPAAAVVDDAVSLARAVGKGSAAGFVNAVLRRISRTKHHLALPPRPEAADPAREAALDYLSTTLSHPRWLVERWFARVGFHETERWLQFNNRPAPLTLRANTHRIDRATLSRTLQAAGIQTEPTPFASQGLVVTSGQPLNLRGVGGRLFVAQDEASQLVGELAAAAAPRGGRVLDACAAPGGKTSIIASGPGQPRVVAADVRPRRVRLLRDTVTAAGAQLVSLLQADLLQPLPFGAAFDLVFVDAPCSGLGILRRDPEIRWRRTPDELPVLAGAQRAMLRHAAQVVRPGGRLIYSTCSSEPDENEDVISSFLSDHPQFTLENAEAVARLLPDGAGRLVDPNGWFQTWPWRDALEAFFAAVLRADT